MLALDAVAAEATGVPVEDADQENVMAVLDVQARKWLGISGAEFLSAWRAGDYNGGDDAKLGRLVSTALLLS